MADEFFRPSYTSGAWAWGKIGQKLDYIAMVGNNLSTLGVSAAQLDNGFNTVSTSLVWKPTTGEFGPGFGDFENHENLATRLGVHFTYSEESKQSQPNSEGFENTQIRLADGTVIFTPNIFGNGIVVNDLTYKMTSFDGGLNTADCRWTESTSCDGWAGFMGQGLLGCLSFSTMDFKRRFLPWSSLNTCRSTLEGPLFLENTGSHGIFGWE
jgi:hypothetical protein